MTRFVPSDNSHMIDVSSSLTAQLTPESSLFGLSRFPRLGISVAVPKTMALQTCSFPPMRVATVTGTLVLSLSLALGGTACSGSEPSEGTCEYNGNKYEAGDSFDHSDGCNECLCNDDGDISCTLIDCAPDPNDACTLAFEAGDCEAAIPSFWHNPDTGECEEKVYGGCGGNENRYASLADCEEACVDSGSGISCEVDGVEYPDGSTDVPDPGSCNTCSCVDGVVTGCTEINCPVECEEGFSLGTECAECGPTDACLSIRTGCLPQCETQDDCSDSGSDCSSEGVCTYACG